MKRIVVFALVLNAALLGVIAHQLVAIAGGGVVAEVNGDTNGDGQRDISDATYYLRWLFQGGPEPVAFAGGPDHSADIAELQGQVASLRTDMDAGAAADQAASTQIAELQLGVSRNEDAARRNRGGIVDLAANPLPAHWAEILSLMSIEQLPVDDDGATARTIRFTGVNVQVVNGSGETAERNGLGNLIVGYQELRTNEANVREGSHNLVVGKMNNYFYTCGQVVGARNTISGDFSSVCGGYRNTASGNSSTVGGGRENTAVHMASTVSGGWGNEAREQYSTVSGGAGNTATERFSTVSGGQGNTASATHSTVSGGKDNTAEDVYSTVSGGWENTASGFYSTVSGGERNTASGSVSTVSGGTHNIASGEASTVSGGLRNTASGTHSTVSGGGDNTAENAGQHIP